MKPRLENWYFIHGLCVGNVYNHPQFEDGERVRTSKIIQWMRWGEGHILETENSLYLLGKPLELVKPQPVFHEKCYEL